MQHAVYSEPAFWVGEGLASLKANIAFNLSRLLEQRQLSQREFSERIEVNESTVSTWLSGDKMPRDDKIEKMCSVLSCTFEELVRDPGVPEADKDPVLRYLRRQLNDLGYDVIKKP